MLNGNCYTEIARNNRQWMLVKSFNNQSIQYTDTTVMPDVLYRYLLVVVDSAGNESKPTKVVSAKHIAVHDFAWIEPQVGG